ncbi:NAD-dependent epimerase/dehydratase family protein (plasmid) [Deinococcus sp. KNUC1210]|uniref:NAD-dependent epimerase/dehydratase family protein n=1 Tax=Deinococcus sp. KNUC1210 TaxID=2917691 RepID=UPI001EF04CA1|nr:NAD-dependent epimerase/dehydratase family protein [Deinococcus sp. KNUC1210]ULH17913.1 NAD-dependent epimerase/dehydratase family protein [Deinococcus sp. KNUC1210]
MISPDVERLRGDRDQGLAGLHALRNRTWDACLDVSGYTPRQVRPSAECLRTQVQRYVFISSVSVYGDPQHRPVVETDSLLPPAADDETEITGETYGPLKVACEQVVQALYGSRSTILRPQIVAGPHDPTGRYPYWVNRAMLGGEMLAPGDGSDHLQVIDVRDLARFAVRVVEDAQGGVFNVVGPRLSWSTFIQVLGAQTVTWVRTQVLEAQGVTSQELPLFRPEHGPLSSLMHVDPARSVAAGLVLTDPAVTVADTRAWSVTAQLTPVFTPQREAAVLSAARQDPAS